jgi:hypothetical protein
MSCDCIRLRTTEHPVPLYPREKFGTTPEEEPHGRFSGPLAGPGTGQFTEYRATEDRVAQAERLLHGRHPIDEVVEQTGLTRFVVETIRDRLFGRTLPDHHKSVQDYVRAEVRSRKGVLA